MPILCLLLQSFCLLILSFTYFSMQIRCAVYVRYLSFTYFSMQVRCAELMEQSGVRGADKMKQTDLKGLQEIMSFMINEINTFGVVFKPSRHVETIKASLEGAEAIGYIKITNTPYIKSDRPVGLDDFGSLIGGDTCLRRSMSQPDISLSGKKSMQSFGITDTGVPKRVESRPIKKENVSVNRRLTKDSNEFTTVRSSNKTTENKNKKATHGTSGAKRTTAKVQPNVVYVSPIQLPASSSGYGNDISTETNQRQQIATRLREMAHSQRDVNIPRTSVTPSCSAGINRGSTGPRQTSADGDNANTEQRYPSSEVMCNPLDQTESGNIDNIHELDLETLLRTRSQIGSSFPRRINNSNFQQDIGESATGYIEGRGSNTNFGQTDEENASCSEACGNVETHAEPESVNEDGSQTHSSDNETTEPSNASDVSITQVKQVHTEQERGDGDNNEETTDQNVTELQGTDIMTLKSINIQSDASITQVKAAVTGRPREQTHVGLANYKRFTSSQIPLGDNWSFLSDSIPVDSLEGSTSERDILIRRSSSEDSDSSVA